MNTYHKIQDTICVCHLHYSQSNQSSERFFKQATCKQAKNDIYVHEN